MKNFKKVLALVLVMAVVFGFTAMSASAFTDDAEIARKEAVDVMAAIGVINGYTDGSFKPKGDVTRAEMAKMITVLLNKGDDVGDLYKGAVTFADSTSHWAAGYIAYCAQENIINGRNASTFDPNANVTGTEAAKMLLCALGYNPNVEGLVGASWAANTLSLAKKCELKAKNAGGSVNADTSFNLLNDMDSVSMSTPLSREDAAQMILNAMLCTKVDYDGTAQTITIGNTSFTTGAKLLSLEASIYDEYHALGGGKRLDRGAEAGDDFGRPARVWTRGAEEIGSYSKAPTVTYTDTVTGGKVYTDLGKPAFGAAADGKYTLVKVVDGVNVGDADKAKIVSGDTSEIAPVGSWTEIYVDDDAMTITMVTAKYYIAQISNVYAEQKDSNGDVTREAYVTLKKIDDNVIPSGEIELKDGSKITQGFVTDAYTTADRNVTYVVYTKADNKVQTLAKAEAKSGIAGSFTKTVAGKITAFTLDSTSYNVATTAKAFGADYGTNATIYLDPNGNILYAEATASDAVAYVLTAGQTSDGIYGDVTTGANLLFTDGKTQKVNVYNEQGKKYTDAQAAALKGTVVSYTVNASGEYVLTPLATADANTYGYKAGIAKVTSNNPNLPGSQMFANDATTFIVETTSKDSTGAITYSYTTYTGLKNVPTVEEKDADADALVIAGVNTRTAPTTAAYVFVVGGKTKDSAKASVSVFQKMSDGETQNTDANNNTYYTTKAVVDGEISTVKVTEAVYNAIPAKPYLTAYTNMTTDANGYITSLTAAANMNQYVKSFVGFNGDDGLYNNGIVTMKKADDSVESFSVSASIPVYVFNTSAATVTQTTVDAFSITPSLYYHDAKVVLDSSEKLLNNNEI
ncbi:MAG: S-layer homology domain-containing protein, partial [Oscillospiraceae bacterium]|nr:S-layer homology domain-containing protein [Oscillospiraceae bacterium]